MPRGDQVGTLWGLGEAELGLGHTSRARDHLEAALESIAPGTDVLLRARVRFALARAQPPERRERARRLAEAARQELPGLSPWSKDLRQRIDVWLAAHG